MPVACSHDEVSCRHTILLVDDLKGVGINAVLQWKCVLTARFVIGVLHVSPQAERPTTFGT